MKCFDVVTTDKCTNWNFLTVQDGHLTIGVDAHELRRFDRDQPVFELLLELFLLKLLERLL